MDLSSTNWTKEQDIEVNEYLAKVLASPMFAQAERQQRFLRYILAETLAGRAEKLKGYTIGVEVFDRESSFDPVVDANCARRGGAPAYQTAMVDKTILNICWIACSNLLQLNK